MNKRTVYLYIFLVFLTMGFYLFRKGEVTGVVKYKRSKNFQMTLDAAYRYGYDDGSKDIRYSSCYLLGFRDGWDMYYERAHKHESK